MRNASCRLWNTSIITQQNAREKRSLRFGDAKRLCDDARWRGARLLIVSQAKMSECHAIERRSNCFRIAFCSRLLQRGFRTLQGCADLPGTLQVGAFVNQFGEGGRPAHGDCPNKNAMAPAFNFTTGHSKGHAPSPQNIQGLAVCPRCSPAPSSSPKSCLERRRRVGRGLSSPRKM